MSAPKDFLSLADWQAADLRQILARAHELKRSYRRGETPQTLRGRTLALYFEKPSLRTHVTFEAGMSQLGGHAILLRPEQVGIGTRESAADVARNLSRWVHGIVARTYDHALVEELAAAATIPVINGLTDLLHPCQAMADLQTISERADLAKVAVAYVGDGNNVANSLLYGGALLGMDVTVASPKGYEPKKALVDDARKLARSSGATLRIVNDPREGTRDADVVYTDVWASMGQEAQKEERRKLFPPYQVNAALVARAKPDAIVMHCLPAHRGEEITDEIADSQQSALWDQAENRMHAQKAVLAVLLANK